MYRHYFDVRVTISRNCLMNLAQNFEETVFGLDNIKEDLMDVKRIVKRNRRKPFCFLPQQNVRAVILTGTGQTFRLCARVCVYRVVEAGDKHIKHVLKSRDDQ